MASDTTISLEAREWSKKIDQDPTNVEYLTQRAQVLSAEGRFDLAIVDYQKASELEPQEVAHLYSMGDAYFANDQTTLALQQYDEAERVNPNDVTAVFKRGQFLYFVRQFDLSKIVLGKLLVLNPQHSQGNFIMAMLQKETGDTASAIEYFQNTIACLGSDYNSSMQLALIYDKQDQDDLALRYYSNAINIDPTSDEAHYALGLFHQNRAKDLLAMKEYQKQQQQQQKILPVVHRHERSVKFVAVDDDILHHRVHVDQDQQPGHVLLSCVKLLHELSSN